MKKFLVNILVGLSVVAMIWLAYRVWAYGDYWRRRGDEELLRWKMEWASRR